MVGTDPQTMGGVAAVVNVYREAGLFQQYPVRYLSTHRDGGGWTKLRAAAGALLSFAGLLLRGRVSLLHCHTASRNSFWRKTPFFLLAFLFRVPAILHLHGGEFHLFYEKESGPLKRRLIRFIYDHAAHIIVLSERWRQWVSGMSRNPNISVIYNPVLLPQPAPDWSQRVPGQTLFFGRLGKGKGVYDLLAAARELKDGHPGLQLALGGDGEVEQARAAAAELGIGEQTAFLGWVRGEQKLSALRQATIYTLPSYNEGMPMSILEAMAWGLPVLATPVGGIPDAISDGVEGFLVAPGDVGALAQRWAQLLDDPQLAQRMGEAARRKVAAVFATDAVLPRLGQLYQSLGARDA
ncbi:glycosyltransferase family 4 protein [Massilia endophytica]|uniref:glycosyltransferase family 4 protein n=1 Tax=Massilia endophytica TaxID=2899220 RepID=UPI001E5B5E33|nr:glycosyltransferase family 4 protein [Massilia endophytica]UGQ47650.1 glycosyltransferase family 4 protein [Massilia endophytica]